MHKSPELRGQFQKPRNNQLSPRVKRIVLVSTAFVVIGFFFRNSTFNLNPFTTQTAIMDTHKIAKGVNDFGNTVFSHLGENVRN
jgi:hypothetical protein